ncbi:MAG TPA: trypsin-like peptidase domain-containing protein [Rubrobacteraceae bacterium]|nr:trypsin-like peptidase domain-containing protein [Rubrobacteraceae bacterium]
MERREESLAALAALSDGMAALVEQTGPAIVRVHGRRRPSSGVVFTPEMVLAASHALEREEDLSVGTHDGRTLGARLIGRDPATDLAVLKVEGLAVEAARLAEGEARVGQLSLAVGRSGRGEGPIVSVGVISAVGGPLRMRWGMRLERYIRTDAQVFPGLSGGALVDARGGVLGVLTTGLARGVSLAVPAELAWRVAGEISERGSIRRGYLGILSQPVRLPDAQRSGLSQRDGLLVVGVEDGSPAASGGMMVGDIIMTLDGHPVEETEDLLARLTGDRVGHPAEVGVLRGGANETLEVTVGERASRR